MSMDCAVEDETNVTPENDDLNDIKSSENFQKFIHELFERNGVLNDLRAYLRGHIVKVLKSAETGDPLICQKHFTQRLDLTHQALNILIAEYLLRLEFSYSLSVFISEIPLSNMVFEFARTIFKTADTNLTGLRFGECDVWTILNYLGIKCDSEHANKIVELYNSSHESPLLFCILKCLQLYEKAPVYIGPIHTSDENMSSEKTTDVDTEDEKKKKKKSPKNMLTKCKHYAFCKTCQSKINKLKSRYEKKQNKLEKIAKKSSINDSKSNVNSLIKTVNDVEQTLVDEMFEEVKSVYEGEIEMIKEDEQKKIKRSIVKHALELQRHKEQLEESYRAKEEKLEENVKQKKKFLWGLARALKEQHQNMATAMIDVKFETERLIEKENDLKNQLEGAERMLKNKGEKLHNQIVQEIKLLAAHFESMKTEREALDKERSDLDYLKQVYDKNDKILAEYRNDKEDLKVHYVSLKEELNALKKCIEDKVESKSVVEKGTGMEDRNGEEKSLMNNGVSLRNDDGEEDKLKHLVINDFKKKNVNFIKSNQEVKRQSSSSETDVAEAGSAHAVRMLIEENERLKKFAIQQSQHIVALSRERNVLLRGVPAALPATLAPPCFVTNRVPQAGGEEVSASPALRPRALRQGEPVPFIGKDRHSDTRRHLVNQWRTLHRRPLSATTPSNVATPEQFVRSVPECIPEINILDNTEVDDDRRSLQTNDSEVAEPSPALNINKPREKSPKSFLKEAKKKLRNKTTTKHQPMFREKSPNATLREAKLRLRKLEIEAEAVEKSYLDFRRRQSEIKLSKSNVTLSNEAVLDEVKRLNIKQGKIHQKFNEKYKICDKSLKESPELIKRDFDKYLREYQTKYDIGQIHFPNKNAILQKVKPIPSSYSKFNEKLDKDAKNPNYLETPITEFRKFYQNVNSDRNINNDLRIVEQSYEEHKEHQNRDSNIICKKPAELKIIKDYMNKINNITKVLPETYEEIYEVNIKQNINENNANNVKPENVESNITLEDKQKLSEVISNMDVVKSSEQILDVEEKLEEKIEDIQNINELKDLESNTRGNDDAIQNKENLLIVEVENVREENSIQVTKSEDILLIVESAIDNREIENQKENEISTQMTIIISPKPPKNVDINENDNKISSPEKIEKLTENDALNAIYYAKNNEVSSVDLSKKLEESSKSNNSEEYGEDFSADVDNYNSRSDLSNNSPISLPKTSDVDDNFWDT